MSDTIAVEIETLALLSPPIILDRTNSVNVVARDHTLYKHNLYFTVIRYKITDF